MITCKIGIIGGGNMARAIAGGLLRGGMHATNLFISEPVVERCDQLRQELFGAHITEDNRIVAQRADVILFAVKPQILQPVCRELAADIQQNQPLVMSIAAGPCSTDIEEWLGGDLAVIRVMPNQPAMIDQGISALFANALASESQRNLAEKIMAAGWA